MNNTPGSPPPAAPKKRTGLAATALVALLLFYTGFYGLTRPHHLHRGSLGAVKAALDSLRDLLLAAGQVFALFLVLGLVVLLVRWLSSRKEGTAILPFDVAAGADKYSGRGLADALLAEMLRILQIHRQIKDVRPEDSFFAVAAQFGISVQDVGIVPNESFDANLSDVATVAVGDTKLSIGRLLLTLKRLWPWGSTVTVITGSVQRYGGVVSLVARRERDDVRTWEVHKTLTADDEVPDLMRDLAYKILRTLSQDRTAQTWEGFKHYTEALYGYSHYMRTGRSDDLERARANALAAAQAEKGFSALFVLFLYLSNAYRERAGTAIRGGQDVAEDMSRSDLALRGRAQAENLDHSAEMARQAIAFATGHDQPELAPYAWALLSLSYMMRPSRGEIAKAIAPMERALARNPDNPDLLSLLAGVYAVAMDYDKALAIAEKAAALSPDASLPPLVSGSALYYTGRYPEAILALQRAREANARTGEPEAQLAVYHVYLAACYRRLGEADECRKQTETAHRLLPQRTDLTEYDMAADEGMLGDADAALGWLRIALLTGQRTPDYAREDHDFDFIRDDPRFEALLAEASDAAPITDGAGDATPYRVV